MLRNAPLDPRPGTFFDHMDSKGVQGPSDKMSDATRRFLYAATDHLTLWADFAQPLGVQQVVAPNYRLRPSYTLARAAVESSTMALWLVTADEQSTYPNTGAGDNEVRETMRRYCCLTLFDLDEQKKSTVDETEKQRLKQRYDIVKTAFPVTISPASYIPMLGWIAPLIKYESEDLVAQYRALSGLAHGLSHVIGAHSNAVAHPSGRQLLYPNLEKMADAIWLAVRMTDQAMKRYLEKMGFNPWRMAQDAEAAASDVPVAQEPQVDSNDRGYDSGSAAGSGAPR